MKNIIIFLSIFTLHCTYSQTFVFVRNADSKMPIEGASIFVEGISDPMITDSDGNCEIPKVYSSSAEKIGIRIEASNFEGYDSTFSSEDMIHDAALKPGIIINAADESNDSHEFIILFLVLSIVVIQFLVFYKTKINISKLNKSISNKDEFYTETLSKFLSLSFKAV